jgi:hypothetical protein
VPDYTATRIPIPGTGNVRDLGSYPAANGQTGALRRIALPGLEPADGGGPAG